MAVKRIGDTFHTAIDMPRITAGQSDAVPTLAAKGQMPVAGAGCVTDRFMTMPGRSMKTMAEPVRVSLSRNGCQR
jgi:hypothetical protein